MVHVEGSNRRRISDEGTGSHISVCMFSAVVWRSGGKTGTGHPPIPCGSAEDTEPKPLDTVMRDEIIIKASPVGQMDSKQVEIRGQTGTTEPVYCLEEGPILLS